MTGNGATRGGAIHLGPGSTLYLETKERDANVFFMNLADAGEDVMDVEEEAEAQGGAICLEEDSAAVIASSIFDANAAVQGGAIFSAGLLELRDSIMKGDLDEILVTDGGALRNQGAALLYRVHIHAIGVTRNGGGIHNTGILVLDSCTLSNNRSLAGGGLHTESFALIQNSTLVDNRGANRGGAIYVDASGGVEILQSTLSQNASFRGGGIYNVNAAVISRSIVAGNVAALGAEVFTTPEADGTTSEGYNLFGDLTDSGIEPEETDIVDEDPLLGGLEGNGGPTPTMALDAESPAKDVIPADECLDAAEEPLAVDQRGMPRPADELCDIGAFELQ